MSKLSSWEWEPQLPNKIMNMLIRERIWSWMPEPGWKGNTATWVGLKARCKEPYLWVKAGLKAVWAAQTLAASLSNSTSCRLLTHPNLKWINLILQPKLEETMNGRNHNSSKKLRTIIMTQMMIDLLKPRAHIKLQKMKKVKSLTKQVVLGS